MHCHFYAGIINRTEDSLFTYGEGESWSTYYIPDFTPEFEPTFSDPMLEAQANSICGDDTFCLFDIAATGNTDVGVATMQGNEVVMRLMNISLPGKIDKNIVLTTTMI